MLTPQTLWSQGTSIFPTSTAPEGSRSEVTKGAKPSAPKPRSQTPAQDNSYLDLRVSKLSYRNVAFPRRHLVFQLAIEIYNSLAPFRMGHTTLCRARDMASKDHPFSSGEIEARAVELGALIKEASSVPAAAKRIKATLAEASESKAARTNSLVSDHSIDRAHPCRRKEPSSGHGNSKRATVPGTAHSESSRHSSRRTLRPHPGKM